MTIYKANNPQKTEKQILEKKLLAEVQDESEVEARAVPVEIELAIRRRRSKIWLNIFLILVALLVLAAGITGGVLLYRRLSHKIYRGRCGFTALFDEEQKDLTDNGTPHAMAQNDKAKVDPQKHAVKVKPKRYNMQEDVQVIDDKIEKIHMPSFRDFRDTMILHDFEKNYSAIVDYQMQACYVMKLDRKRVSPPRDWIDLIQKFASGYYMPNASVLRRKYRVITPSIRNTEVFGRYISAECLNFHTYRLERMVGDHGIFKRSTGTHLQYAYYEPTGEHLEAIDISLYN